MIRARVALGIALLAGWMFVVTLVGCLTVPAVAFLFWTMR